MAKRVNAKKEKAKRNKINARKYRKSNNKSGGGRRRYTQNESSSQNSENNNSSNKDGESKTSDS